MCTIIIVALIINQLYTIHGSYLEAELNYQKPKRERNNIVNKAVWIRNNFDGGKLDSHQSFFRENSLDFEHQGQNNYNAFDTRFLQGSPFMSDYMERQKRNSNYRRHKRHDDDERISSDKLHLINTLTIDDYPFEVAIRLNNKTNIEQDNTDTFNTDSLNNEPNLSIGDEFKDIDVSIKNGTGYKRSMQYDFEAEVSKHFDLNEEANKTEDNKKVIADPKDNRNIFEKTNSEWHQTAPIPDINVYRVVPKESAVQKSSKPVTERGLIKVISMLTKSFRKIMKQHTEITNIHSKITEIGDEFAKTATSISNKFKDFDLKYIYLVRLQEKLKEYNNKMASKEEYFKNKEKEISKEFLEFENQQKKFLLQQKQFYNMQKLMLAQNEKINMKQSLIAKTQSEISRRQNNFAKILRKAKQIYADRRSPPTTRKVTETPKPKPTPKVRVEPKTVPTSTIQTTQSTTEPIKINLFSVPSYNRIQPDPDELILREKDDQHIDDLVYKYYFNNTYIDSMIQKHILNSFMGSKNIKNKRNELETTILLPVPDNKDNDFDNNRIKRWINHSKSNKRKNRGKDIGNITDGSKYRKDNGVPIDADDVPKPKRHNVDTGLKNDPFLNMALSFCNKIGQNLTHQTLSWCVEKTLRRLQFLEPASTTIDPMAKAKQMMQEDKLLLHILESMHKIGPFNMQQIKSQSETTTERSTTVPPSEQTSTVRTTKSAYTHAPVKKHRMIKHLPFPDNEALEYNLKRLLSEIPPADVEGNVYFEGSVHESDIIEQEK